MMLKRFITIFLLVSFGGLPAAAQVYQVSTEICNVIEQMNTDEDEMSCCLNGNCTMNQHQTIVAQPTTNCANQCICANEPISLPCSVLIDAPQHVNLVAMPMTMARPPSTRTQKQNTLSYQIIPVHKSQETYLHLAKLRL